MNNSVYILGVESSCDDTGVAVVEAHTNGSFTIHANIITRQDHVATGGVVPELAARHHADAIVPTMQQALDEAGKSLQEIDCMAVTYGPGLIACLMTGVEAVKTVAATTGIPVIGVNHMEGHIASTFAEHPDVAFPAMSALVSGGHTMLVHITDPGTYQIIGETRDDAAGEAFDKIARMIGLPYPGGPEVSRLAKDGDPTRFDFPRPMLHNDDHDFSFAGLKTSVLYTIRDMGELTEQDRCDIAASAQAAIVDVLVAKTVQAAEAYGSKSIILGGGVSANRALQDHLKAVTAQRLPETEVIIPSPGLFTDNGAMIAIAAGPRALVQDYDDWTHIQANPKLRLPQPE